jgi:hypothetical protein
MTAALDTADNEGAVARLTQAQRMLAEARTLSDFHGLRDFASSLRSWAQSRHLGVEAENAAAVFILRAERAAGQELIRMGGQRAVKGRFVGDQPRVKGRIVKGGGSDLPTLADLGISPTASANWQRLATVSDEHFERMIAEALAPASDGSVSRIAKKRFYPWPEDHREYRETTYRKDDPLTPLFHLRTYADQVIGSSLARLSRDDLVAIGKLGVRLVKAARAEMDRRGL